MTDREILVKIESFIPTDIPEAQELFAAIARQANYLDARDEEQKVLDELATEGVLTLDEPPAEVIEEMYKEFLAHDAMRRGIDYDVYGY